MEQLYDADADTWTKALAIGKYVAANIPHDNQEIEPEHRNAIDLWEYTKNIEPAFNCRLHSLLTFELLLAAGLDARYVTCMPGDEEDTECHVMNEVWLPELGKWAMIDTDMDGNYASDLDAMLWADTCVLVLPCGRSAHTEAGWFAGKGLKTIVYMPEKQEPELMYKLFDGVVGRLDELLDALS